MADQRTQSGIGQFTAHGAAREVAGGGGDGLSGELERLPDLGRARQTSTLEDGISMKKIQVDAAAVAQNVHVAASRTRPHADADAHLHSVRISLNEQFTT